MGSAIDAWIEYDDDAQYYPERAAEPPFSSYCDNCVPLDWFIQCSNAKDYRFFAAISGIRARQDDPSPLFPLRGGLPPNASQQTNDAISEIIGKNNPRLSWLSYPEIEQALAHMGIQRDKLDLTTNLVLDLMQSYREAAGRRSFKVDLLHRLVRE